MSRTQHKACACRCLFVYGSLRRGSGHPMSKILARQAHYLGPAELCARLYRIGTYCGIKLSAQASEQVQGDLYRLSTSLTLLRRLDDYENHMPRRPAHGEFLRIAVHVRRRYKYPQLAWVYTYNRDVTEIWRIVSGNFLAGRNSPAGTANVPSAAPAN